MSNISIFSAIKNNNLYEIAKEFILPYEKFCVQLVEKLFQKDEDVMIVLREVGGDFLICGLFYYSKGGTVLPFFIDKDFDVEQTLKSFFAEHLVFCVSGEKSCADFVVQCVESAKKQIVKERRSFILMESKSAEKKEIKKDGFIFRRCNKNDSEELFSLQIDYIKEEVVPKGVEINLPAERFAMDRLLKNEKIFAVTDDSGKIICKAQINSEINSYLLLGGVFTTESYRKNGLAFFLMENIKNVCADKKCILFVNSLNVAAFALYKKSGFVECGKFSIVYIA